MKKYAMLRIGKNGCDLLDDKGNSILSFNIVDEHYIYEIPIYFNLYSKEGWEVEHLYTENNTFKWYLMSKEYNNE